MLDEVYRTTGAFGESGSGNQRTVEEAMPFLASQETHSESSLLRKAIKTKAIGSDMVVRVLRAAVMRHNVEASYMRSSVSLGSGRW